jgi:hypothetical protein
MRILRALKQYGPVFAAIALAACSGNADEELAGEALSADEVAGAAAADFTMPRAGEYRTTQELIEFTLPGLPAEQMEMVRSQFAAGAAQPHTYCVNEQMTREQWLSQMSESNCTVSSSAADAGGIDMVMSCTGAEGVAGRVALKGTTTAEGSDMEMTFTQAIPNMGDSTIRMRVKSERVGDCA